jgi:predicted AlkP superfamily phosphohydrolase/phosphomutase
LEEFVKSGLEFAKRLGLKVLPPTIKRLLYRRTNLPDMVESWARFSAIDWKRTQAFSEETPYFPSIWINLRGREPLGIVESHEYEKVRAHIAAQLTLWRNPVSGQRMVKRVHRREEIYAGSHVDKAPDLMIEWELDHGYSYLFRPSTGTSRSSLRVLNGQEKKRVKSGDHRAEGIFLMTGADLIASREVKEVHITDLAPTILYHLGVPIPLDMDGAVLTQIFTNEYLTAHPVRYGHALGSDGDLTTSLCDYSAAEEEAIRERLHGLGYIE